MPAAIVVAMKISDVTCQCGAVYRRAESESVTQKAGARTFRCEACGTLLEKWDKAAAIAYRLVIEPCTAPVSGVPSPATGHSEIFRQG